MGMIVAGDRKHPQEMAQPSDYFMAQNSLGKYPQPVFHSTMAP
jgi:hypothetical protein